MKAGLISLGSTSSQWVYEAMKKYFDEVDMLDIKKIEVALGNGDNPIYYDRKPLEHYDCLYVKGSHKYADLLRSITTLTPDTYFPICPTAFTEGHDKLLTHLNIAKNRIPTPKTYFCGTLKAAKELIKDISFPLVMKFPKGTHGKGVMFVDSVESANSVFDALVTLNQPFIIQEFIDTEGKDIRAFVVGDKVVASMERCAVNGEKRANVHTGGQINRIELDAVTKKIAVNAAKAIKAEICGVDMLYTPKGPVVVEINLSPSLQGITKATDIDIADIIAKYLFIQTKAHKDKHTKKSAECLLEELGITSSTVCRDSKGIYANLDFRGNRILLPEFVTEIANFNEQKEILVKIKKGTINICQND